MRPITRRTVLAAAASALAAPTLAQAQAQAGFPSKPIRLVVPFPAGGSVDPLARVLGERMTQAFGQQVIVDNRAGGNTVIGTDFVAKAPADGYTLLLTASSHVTQPQLLTAPFDPIKDFAPVATVSASDMILCVHPSVPANNLQEFLALAKAKPGALNFSSAGSGNPNHLAGELLSMMANVKFTHVPYKGGAPAIVDLVGGQVQFSFGSPIIVLPHIRSGRLKAIAVTSAQRMSLLPNVPTIAESGVAELATEINRITALPEMKERLDAAGMERLMVPTERYEAVMRQDMEKFGRIIKTANVKLD